nr:uncharacterized protein LOC106835331 isoform X3 [Equus asinus]
MPRPNFDCRIPLLGRDLLCELNAQITFSPKKKQLHLQVPPENALRLQALLERTEEGEHPIPPEIHERVSTAVWADGVPGRARSATPIKIELKKGASCPRKKQYPLKKEALKGIQPVLQRFLHHGLIRPCQSPYNTPILPVKKPHSDEYRFVQDLRATNDIVQDIHPTVPNPYTLLTTVPGEYGWFSVLDLKDAFFCIPLERKSQLLFAFEWQDPDTRATNQYCWTVLPQGFKNSPTLFNETLAKDLRGLQLNQGTLLQYVDDLLIASPSYQHCLNNTIIVPNHLAWCGYKVSPTKAQICKQQVAYLGFQISQGTRNLMSDRRQAILQVRAPQNRRQLRYGRVLPDLESQFWIDSQTII